MAIPVGTSLGPYEVLSAIGAGGMGEVYKARDTRLDRTVAIKVLPDHFADRGILRERFEREAKTIASLNHPHICTLYDVGREGGTDYLVMEYIEGETLAQRLTKGALPLDQTLRYAIEIADALDKAHRKGITHRDLKPSNIMLTKTGTKLLDFGLAKLTQGDKPAAPLSELPTEMDGITAEGTILGTLQYMAPEQVEGKTGEIDARTDMFSFGSVVYEMVTGKKAFEGKSQASVMAKILETDPPPMPSLQPMTPPALDHVVTTCLMKNPDDRWQTASDLCRELKWIAEVASQIPSPSAAPAKGFRAFTKKPLIIALGTLVLGALIAAVAVWNLKPAARRQVSRLSVSLPPDSQLAERLNESAVAISSDGTQLAFVATRGGTRQLYLRAIDSQEARPVPETDGASNPFFSPDGQWLGFFSGEKLKKISATGGTAITLCDAANGLGASWSSKGTIVFGTVGPLMEVSDTGGTPQTLTHLERGEVAHAWPEFLPDGKSVLFVSAPADNVAVYSPELGARRNLISGATSPRFLSSGYLIYAQAGGNLMAVSFDAQRQMITGAAVPVVEGVLTSPSNGETQYSISQAGSLIYVSGDEEAAQRKLVWVDRKGTQQELAAPPRAYRYPRLSPDRQRVGASIEERGGGQIWLYDLRRDTLIRWTFEGTNNLIGAWTPDGSRIVFRSNKEELPNLFWQRADGSGGLERLTTSEYSQNPNSWSPDGQTLAFVQINPQTGYDIWVLRMGTRKAEPFLQTSSTESAPRFSPDGRWLAYTSDESGRTEVFVQSYAGSGGKWQISADGGTEPVWNPNGRELFYRTGAKMMAVDIDTQPTFSAGKGRLLFEGPYLPTPATFPNYDVSADGQRFLMIKALGKTQVPTQINVVLNWFEELKQKVPTSKK